MFIKNKFYYINFYHLLCFKQTKYEKGQQHKGSYPYALTRNRKTNELVIKENRNTIWDFVCHIHTKNYEFIR
jgi:hypothetical protein